MNQKVNKLKENSKKFLENLTQQDQEEFFPHEALSAIKMTGSTEMSPAKYRRKFNVEREKDVGHIISRANGGPDYVQNFFACPRFFNRNIGATGDALNAVLVGPERAHHAVRVSRKYGSYKGVSGIELYEQGKAILKEKGLRMKLFESKKVVIPVDLEPNAQIEIVDKGGNKVVLKHVPGQGIVRM